MIDLRDWYAKPRPDSRSSLFNFLTKDEKEALKKIKRQIRTFERMNTKEYEKLQSEYAECVFCLIESFVKEEDKEQIKQKIEEEVRSISIVDLNNTKILSIAKKVYAEYNNISCPLDDSRAYRLSEEFYELLGGGKV